MARRERPLRGGGNDAIDYRAALEDVLAGTVTELHESFAPGGSRTENLDVFVPDASGGAVVDGVRGRFDRIEVSVPVKRLAALHAEVPDRGKPDDAPGKPRSPRVGR